jgi:hypothetical protein
MWFLGGSRFLMGPTLQKMTWNEKVAENHHVPHIWNTVDQIHILMLTYASVV